MSETNETSEVDSEVPGQIALLPEEMGYEVILLDNPVHEKFCWEYVLRATSGKQAYKTVKPDVMDSTARVEASKLLTNPDIIQRIQQIRAELLRKYTVTADDLMMYHGKVLKIDRNEFIDADGGKRTYKPIENIEAEAASILELEDIVLDKEGNSFVRYSVPKRFQSAIEMAKILGLNKERKEISGLNGEPLEVNHSGAVGVSDDAEKLATMREKFRSVVTNGSSESVSTA